MGIEQHDTITIRQGSMSEITPISTNEVHAMFAEELDKIPGRIFISANRVPASFKRVPDPKNNGKFLLERGEVSPGGLVTVFKELAPHADNLAWVGYVGDTTDVEPEGLEEAMRSNPNGTGVERIPLIPVKMSNKIFKGYYNDFSNNFWFALHGGLLTKLINFRKMKQSWGDYKEGNKAFAEAHVANATENDFLWENDYHHVLVAKDVRELNAKLGRQNPKMGMYMHTPIFTPEDFALLEKGFGKKESLELLEGLLSYDIVGFSSIKNRDNYIACLQANAKQLPGLKIGREDYAGGVIVEYQGRTILLKKYAVGLDPKAWQEKASTPTVAEKAKQLSQFIHHWNEEENARIDDNGLKIGNLARLEPTKGFPHGARAFSRLLDTHPELIGLVQYIMVAPSESRMDNPHYQHLRNRMEQWTRAMNNRIHRVTGNNNITAAVLSLSGLRAEELLAFYQALDVFDVPPVADGTNLAVQEGALSGAKTVVVGKNTGVAENIPHMQTVDPYNFQGHADILYKMLMGMSREEKIAYMKAVIEDIYQHNIFDYAKKFLGDGAKLFAA